MNSATIRIDAGDAEEAKLLAATLRPDDGEHATVTVDGQDLVVAAVSESTMGLLRTLDDVLECLRAARPDL